MDSLDCCESCWLDQLNWHSSSSAHGRYNAFLGDYGACFPRALSARGKSFFPCWAVHVLAEKWGCTRSGGYCACLRRSHPQNSSRAATAPQFSETVTSFISAYCFKLITNILSMQQALVKYPPYSLCHDPSEKSWGARRELGLAATYSQSCYSFGVEVLHITQCFSSLILSKSYLEILRK